jgi:hypothetical protein
MAASIQLGRKLGYKDVLIVEKGTDIGGTWRDNVYPGAGQSSSSSPGIEAHVVGSQGTIFLSLCTVSA